jgi:hypothetical protein
MIDLALTPNQREAFEASLLDSHRIRIGLSIHDQDEREIDTIRGKLLSGSVQVDAAGEVTRSLALELLDEERSMRFEPNSPADGALYVDRFIGVTYGVEVVALERWVDVPVFFGPLTKVDRRGPIVRVEAQGKERLLLAPHYATQGYSVRKRTRVDDAIRQVAGKAGEEKFALPDMGVRLRRARGVGPESEPWKVIKGGEVTAKGKTLPGLIDSAASSNLVPFYDGRGYLTARRRDAPTVFTFKGDALLDEPTVEYDVSAFRNTVIVRGGKKGKKGRAGGRASLPGAHPLSPRSLARHGDPRYLTEFVEADGLKTDQKCRRRAEELLAKLSTEGVKASFNCLPVPHLEENDEVTLRTPEASVTFSVREMTIPLTASTSMSVGTTKPIRR